MKMRVGNKLFETRQKRQMKQIEMSDLLGVSPAIYSRLERNETSIDLEQILNFSKTLDVPVQDFLPETLSISGNNQQSQVGFVIGNFNSYGKEYTEALKAATNSSPKKTPTSKKRTPFWKAASKIWKRE